MCTAPNTFADEHAVVLDVNGLVPPPAVSASGHFDDGIGTHGALRGLRPRRLRAADMDECVRLHRSLFPIEYERRFYDAAVSETENVVTLGAFEPTSATRGAGVPTAPERMVAVVTARVQARIEDEDKPVRRFLRRDARFVAGTLKTFLRKTWRRVRARHPRRSEPGTTSFGTPAFAIPGPSEYTPYVYVLTVGVDAEYRRRGIAKALLERALSRAAKERGCAVAYLHVISHDVGALRMYESLGFEVVGKHVDFYTLDPAQIPVPGKTRYDAILLGRTCEREKKSDFGCFYGCDLRGGSSGFANPGRGRRLSPLAATARRWDELCRSVLAAVCGRRRKARRRISWGAGDGESLHQN
jgi:histone acetyltransferase MCC1